MGGRSGKSVGPGPRSMEVLEWVARLDVAGFEPVALAVGMSESRLYSHVTRLAQVGWLERIYDRDGSVLALTREGRRAVGLAGAGARPGQVAAVGRAHYRAVSWMAALQTLRGREWVSDREARDQADWLVPVIWPSSRGTHRPDLGGQLPDGQRIAVEVELTHKAPRRLRAILAGYEDAIHAGSLHGVVYVSHRPDVLAAAHRAASAAGLSDDRFATRALADVQADTRREANADQAAPHARDATMA